MSIAPTHGVIGPPPYDRGDLLEHLRRCPHRGRRLVRLNERDAARKLGWDRTTVIRALDDLERDGLARRWKNLGQQGLLVEILD
jgi:DNA-binding MarR family transcriptional regulator